MQQDTIKENFAAFEAQWNYSMDYAREILDVGLDPVGKFFDAQKIGEFCEGIPKSAHYTAKILSVMAGDCGPCVQLVVDMAASEGVPAADLATLVGGRYELLPQDMRLTAQFTQALLARNENLAGLRAQMRERYGNAGLISVAYGIIHASMYPVLKYALGHGQGCAKIEVDKEQVIPMSPVSPSALHRVP